MPHSAMSPLLRQTVRQHLLSCLLSCLVISLLSGQAIAQAPPGAGGPPGGPDGPGALGGPGGETEAAEPLVSKAQTQLSDLATVKHVEAITTVFDFALLDACQLNTGTGFCPDQPLTLAALAKAVTKATLLVRGDEPKNFIDYSVKQGWLNNAAASQAVTGYQAARALLMALGVKALDDAAVANALKQHALTQGLNDIDLSQPLLRDNAAQMIANALSISDGKGAIPIVKHNSPINVGSGKLVVDNTRAFQFGGSAVQDSGESVLVVRNSRIDGDSSATTKSLSGNPAGLLIAGSIRTTLALSQSQAFYFNSSVISKDWAAFSTDGAVPITQQGQKELSLYSYGSLVKTLQGGYGVYSDLFCNTYLFGSTVQAAEVGVISGTYGAVTIGTIGDGETNAALAEQLANQDKQQQTNKQLGSTIVGGRNALMIHSVNLPPYWGFTGYSQTELPLHSTHITIHGGSLSTDLSLDKQAQYTTERQAFIKHVAGSVILVRSSNADINLDGVKLSAGKGGSGALIHTVINNDTRFMVKVPDGETYPGTQIKMRAMNVQGDIISEDYQRDLSLTLTGTNLSGKIISGTVTGWNASAQAGGFSAYIIDANGYKTAHGVKLVLDDKSSWTVTGNSSLHTLTLSNGAKLTAPQGKTLTMKVNGVATTLKPGSYTGTVELTVS